MRKEVMQQALDALDLSQSLLEKSRHHQKILGAYTALSAAIAQQAQPVVEGDFETWYDTYKWTANAEITNKQISRDSYAAGMVAIAQPISDLADRIKDEIAHAEVNNMRLVPFFGQAEGRLAVPVSSLEAAIEASMTQPAHGIGEQA